MRISSQSSMTVPTTGALVGELSDWLENLPAEARVTAVTEQGDRGGSGNVRFTASWETGI